MPAIQKVTFKIRMIKFFSVIFSMPRNEIQSNRSLANCSTATKSNFYRITGSKGVDILYENNIFFVKFIISYVKAKMYYHYNNKRYICTEICDKV